MKLAEEPENIFSSVGENVEQMVGEVGEEEQRVVEEIESLCMSCHETGQTRLLLTSIPSFREVVLMSFECPHCGFRNAEIQSAGIIQERGCKYILQCCQTEDFDRQVVRSEYCTARFIELELEIPAGRGKLTTVEGLLAEVLDDLEEEQLARKEKDLDSFTKIQSFIEKGRAMLRGESLPATLEIDDPAGNSWIEPASGEDEHWTRMEYVRTREQDQFLHLEPGSEGVSHEVPEDIDIKPDEVHTFPASCPSCRITCETRMRLVDIPHFKEVIIMSTVCDHCGYKSNEVKTGGEIPSTGRKITLRVEDAEDLARDILKSESCAMSVPELNLQLHPGTLGGRFTTIEGLIRQVKEELFERIYSSQSDSMEAEKREKWEVFFQGLQDALDGKRKFTIILNDPLAASYMQNLYAPDPDPNMTIEDIERTDEENEDLGLNDLVTENYHDEANHAGET